MTQEEFTQFVANKDTTNLIDSFKSIMSDELENEFKEFTASVFDDNGFKQKD